MMPRMVTGTVGLGATAEGRRRLGGPQVALGHGYRPYHDPSYDAHLLCSGRTCGRTIGRAFEDLAVECSRFNKPLRRPTYLRPRFAALSRAMLSRAACSSFRAYTARRVSSAILR